MAVINKYHHSNRCPFGSVDIMRGSEFGNPYRIGIHGGREAVIEKFRGYLAKRLDADPWFREKVRSLYEKDLCCCCAPQACHGDVLEAEAMRLQQEHEAALIEAHREQEEAEQADLEALFGPPVEL